MRLVSSAFLSALVLVPRRGADAAQPAQAKADTINCLIELNAARAKADLDPFSTEQTAGKKLPIEEQGYKDAVCSQIRKESVFILTGTPNNSTSNDADKQHNMEMVGEVTHNGGSYARDGTYAYAPQEGTTGNCTAAVRHWAEAYVNFGDDPPPVYTNDSTGVYADVRNRSFVALFNPKKSATIDCAYFSCPISTEETPNGNGGSSNGGGSGSGSGGNGAGGNGALNGRSQESEHHTPTDLEGQSEEDEAAPFAFPVSEETGSRQLQEEQKDEAADSAQKQPPRRLSTSTQFVRGLVCLTNPPALVSGQMPFTKDEWDDIEDSFQNSASVSALSLFLTSFIFTLVFFISI